MKPDDLQTRNLSLNRIDYGKERGSFRAYNMVEVTLRDMSKVGDAVTAVTEAGANVMSGPDLRVSNREAANRSAYAAAYRAARARAEAYAGAAELKIDAGAGDLRRRRELTTDAMDAARCDGRSPQHVGRAAPAAAGPVQRRA